jgi:endonuclease IV
MYPTLPKSYKGIFPFKIACPSYIYPDAFEKNVAMLAPYLDEIELLLFESSIESLPTIKTIKKLFLLAEEFDITYNVHLPIDIYLGDQVQSKRDHAVDTVKKVLDLTSPLTPSTHTLHLEYKDSSHAKETVKKWREIISGSMERLIPQWIKGENISIETLMYPFEWVDEIIARFNLSVCIDIGHLILQESELEPIFARYAQTTPIIHLHGVENERAHVSLERISKKNMGSIMRILKRYRGVVSLEVFSYHHLKDSLRFLEKSWHL